MDQTADLFTEIATDRDRDQFLRELISELASVLEDSVGLEEAEGFLAMVGNRLGRTMNREYLAAAGAERLDAAQVAAALVDLKRRIRGGFEVIGLNDDGIVLKNRACPFGRVVEGRQSLCMMTSNVFGRIAAENLGYARVELKETIARGDGGCTVVVHFDEGGPGREYYS